MGDPARAGHGIRRKREVYVVFRFSIREPDFLTGFFPSPGRARGQHDEYPVLTRRERVKAVPALLVRQRFLAQAFGFQYHGHASSRGDALAKEQSPTLSRTGIRRA